jgi:hypothetical protein
MGPHEEPPTLPFPRDQARFDHLRSLQPAEAIRAWLNGSFGFGDEPALTEAILKDPRMDLSPREIVDVLGDAVDEAPAPSQRWNCF